MQPKFLYILRGVPGCGKSTVAKSLGGVVCEADQYFMQEGIEPKLDFQSLENAHKYCFNKCETALQSGEAVVVVANTNVKAKDVVAYRQLGLKYEYNVFVLTVENWHGGVDVHGVSPEKHKRMADALRNSIKFM